MKRLTDECTISQKDAVDTITGTLAEVSLL